MDDNLEEIELLSELSRRIGVKHSLTLCVEGRGRGHLPADLNRTVLRLREIQKSCPELLILPGYLAGFNGQDRGLCRNGQNLLAVDSEGQILRCLDRPDEPVGSLAHEELSYLLKKLRAVAANNPCDECWTSCRGIVEPLLYGPERLANWRYHLTAIKPEPVRAGGPEAGS
jgi:hypothetical protein